MTDWDELSLIESTESDLAQTILKGGWIESWLSCQIVGCKERLPHRHYICKTCGSLDFANTECAECWNMKETHKVGRKIAKFRQRYGMSLHRMGLCIAAFILSVLATVRIK